MTDAGVDPGFFEGGGSLEKNWKNLEKNGQNFVPGQM